MHCSPNTSDNVIKHALIYKNPHRSRFAGDLVASASCQWSGPRPCLKTQTAGLCRLCFVSTGERVGGVEVVICSLGGIQDMAGARAS